MDRDQLMELLTTDDIIGIMQELGSDYPKKDSQGNLYFQTVCHFGDRFKLHYFTGTKLFMCYTNCGAMSIYDLIMQTTSCDFKEAYAFILKYKGIKNSRSKGYGLKQKLNSDDDIFLDKHLYKPIKSKVELPRFNKNVLKIFDRYYPESWSNEGIKDSVANEFGVGFYFTQGKCIIPHYDINNNLVGIRGRSFLEGDLLQGRKYIPLKIQNLTYRYPTRFNLFGINKNKENIKKCRKAILFESEKSVMLYGSLYGQENNISLATMGMNLTSQQRDLLLEIGVEEVIICWDKQYMIEYLDEEHKDRKEYKEFVMYVKKIKKAIDMLVDYFTVSLVLCWNDDIDYKDAPIDKGKEVFEKLLRNRYVIDCSEELEEII